MNRAHLIKTRQLKEFPDYAKRCIRPLKKNNVRMKRLICFLFIAAIVYKGIGQVLPNPSFIKEMKWGLDYRINLTLANDSVYSINIEDLIHSKSVMADTSSQDFIYYPVMLAKDFVDKLKTTNTNTSDTTSSASVKPTSLWSALHESIGGGWLHFVNCVHYSLETKYLNLSSPLMERPKTSWKPKPVTAPYLRTKNWKYYIPLDQKSAQKEYYLKAKEKSLANLEDLPKDFLRLFLETNNRNYKKIVKTQDYKSQSKIDLVRLLVGANYLGNAQISYIKTMVLKSVLLYSYNQLPSIIVFDDLEAAVIMSLNESGYNLEKIVYRNASTLSSDEIAEKRQKIEQTIHGINSINQKIFEQRLQRYYK